MLCLCKSRARRGLAARMLVVRCDHLARTRPDSSFQLERVALLATPPATNAGGRISRASALSVRSTPTPRPVRREFVRNVRARDRREARRVRSGLVSVCAFAARPPAGVVWRGSPTKRIPGIRPGCHWRRADKGRGFPPVSKPRSAVMPVTAEATAIRPFRIEVTEGQLAELRRRIEATRWPSKELVADRSQGVQLRRCRSSRATGRASTTGAGVRRD